jgi:hypothetical protein
MIWSLKFFWLAIQVCLHSSVQIYPCNSMFFSPV